MNGTQFMVVIDAVIEVAGRINTAQISPGNESGHPEFNGKLVLPGFHDVHRHTRIAYALPRNHCTICGGCSIKLHLPSLDNCITCQNDDDRILVRNCRNDEIINAQEMSRTSPDELMADKPSPIFNQREHSSTVKAVNRGHGRWGGSLIDVKPDCPGKFLYARYHAALVAR